MPKRPAEEAVLDRAVDKWVLELDLHPAQQEVWNDPARFKVVAAGRRFGKSLLAAAKCIEKAASKSDAVVMWVSPSHNQSRIGFNMVRQALPAGSREINKTLSEIYLSTGGTILFRSAELYDNLRGWGIDFVVLDEAAYIAKEVWTQVVRPSLSDRHGEAMLIGTFNGENWFYDLWRDAQEPDNLEWQGFKFITADNPYITQSEIDEYERNNPREVFEQEFLSSPLSFSGAVFQGAKLDEAWELGKSFETPSKIQVAQPGGRTVLLQQPPTEAGLDWGWLNTALEVGYEESDKIYWVDEHIYQRVELGEICTDLCRLIKHWNIQTIYADAAGATENVTLAKYIEDAGINCMIQPVPFATYKRAGILARQWYLERGLEAITEACHQLLLDSKGYHWDPRTGAGDEKPAKGHDHTVDAATAFYAPRAWVMGEGERDNG